MPWIKSNAGIHVEIDEVCKTTFIQISLNNHQIITERDRKMMCLFQNEKRHFHKSISAVKLRPHYIWPVTPPNGIG